MIALPYFAGLALGLHKRVYERERLFRLKTNGPGVGARSAVGRIINKMKQRITREKIFSDEWDENKSQLLFLVPLVQTAWAHGAIARNEKNLIFEAAREDEVDARSPLNDQLDHWLVYQPSRKFFVECLDKIMEVLQPMTVREREALKTKIINRCRRIAGSAGGNSSMDVSSFISPEEEETLAEIAEKLDITVRDGRSGLRRETQHGFR